MLFVIIYKNYVLLCLISFGSISYFSYQKASFLSLETCQICLNLVLSQLNFSGVLMNAQKPVLQNKKLRFVAFANFYDINTTTMVIFKP
jgi:hypothetical protein